MAPQVVHFEGASSRGEKRKEIGASKLTFDGRKKKKATEKRQNSWKDLNSKVSLVAEEDLDLDEIKDPDLDAQLGLFHDNQRCLNWRAPVDIIDIYKLYGLNDAFKMDLLVEPPELCPWKISPLILGVDGQVVDLMKERELKRPEKIDLEGPEEKIDRTGGTGRDGQRDNNRRDMKRWLI